MTHLQLQLCKIKHTLCLLTLILAASHHDAAPLPDPYYSNSKNPELFIRAVLSRMASIALHSLFNTTNVHFSERAVSSPSPRESLRNATTITPKPCISPAPSSGLDGRTVVIQIGTLPTPTYTTRPFYSHSDSSPISLVGAGSLASTKPQPTMTDTARPSIFYDSDDAIFTGNSMASTAPTPVSTTSAHQSVTPPAIESSPLHMIHRSSRPTAALPSLRSFPSTLPPMLIDAVPTRTLPARPKEDILFPSPTHTQYNADTILPAYLPIATTTGEQIVALPIPSISKITQMHNNTMTDTIITANPRPTFTQAPAAHSRAPLYLSASPSEGEEIVIKSVPLASTNVGTQESPVLSLSKSPLSPPDNISADLVITIISVSPSSTPRPFVPPSFTNLNANNNLSAPEKSKTYPTESTRTPSVSRSQTDLYSKTIIIETSKSIRPTLTNSPNPSVFVPRNSIETTLYTPASSNLHHLLPLPILGSSSSPTASTTIAFGTPHISIAATTAIELTRTPRPSTFIPIIDSATTPTSTRTPLPTKRPFNMQRTQTIPTLSTSPQYTKVPYKSPIFNATPTISHTPRPTKLPTESPYSQKATNFAPTPAPSQSVSNSSGLKQSLSITPRPRLKHAITSTTHNPLPSRTPSSLFEQGQTITHTPRSTIRPRSTITPQPLLSNTPSIPPAVTDRLQTTPTTSSPSNSQFVQPKPVLTHQPLSTERAVYKINSNIPTMTATTSKSSSPRVAMSPVTIYSALPTMTATVSPTRTARPSLRPVKLYSSLPTMTHTATPSVTPAPSHSGRPFMIPVNIYSSLPTMTHTASPSTEIYEALPLASESMGARAPIFAAIPLASPSNENISTINYNGTASNSPAITTISGSSGGSSVRPSASVSPSTIYSPYIPTASSSFVSPIPSPNDGNGASVCFPASARVTLADGQIIRIDNLRVGMLVRSAHGAASEVYGFSHAEMSGQYRFVVIETAVGTLILTASHYVVTATGSKPAGTVKIEDELLLGANRGYATVTRVSEQLMNGLYNPHTLSGTIEVDGFITSTFTQHVESTSAQAALTPFRMLYALGARLDILWYTLESGGLYSAAQKWLH